MTSLKNGVNLSSSFGHLISDKRTLSSSLLNYFFSRIVRLGSAVVLGNAVVHALARRAFLSFSLSVWMEPVPQNISSLVLADLLAPL